MCFIESTLTAVLSEPSLLQLISTQMRLSYWIKTCGDISSQPSSFSTSSASNRPSSSHQNSGSMKESSSTMHQVVHCDANGHASVISRSFKSGRRVLAAGLQAMLSSSIEADAIFKHCLNKVWRLGYAEFRSLDRLARVTRESSEKSNTFFSVWDSSMGQVMRLLHNFMICGSLLLQRSAISSQSEKTITLRAIVFPAMSSAAWLNDIDQIISVAPLPMTRGLHQATATLLSCVVQNISHLQDVVRDARVNQLFRNGTMFKLQVLKRIEM
jgi:hypothetical protein